MKFGELKTIVENKLTKSFVDSNLKKDLKIFNNLLKVDKSFAKMMNGYDTLNENKGISKEVASFMFDEVVSELKNIKINESTLKSIKSWTNGIKIENRYENIDEFIFSKNLKIEEKYEIKKTIVENITKKSIKKESPKLPLSSLVKVANNTIKKHLETLDESEKQKVLNILKSEETSKENFEKLKESTIVKIDNLINESDENTKNVLIETKNKISSIEFSKKEYVKLLSLNEGL